VDALNAAMFSLLLSFGAKESRLKNFELINTPSKKIYERKFL